MSPSLAEIASQHPFPDYQDWWPMRPDFIRFMARSIYEQWAALTSRDSNLAPVQAHIEEYIRIVYHRPTAPSLLQHFIAQPEAHDWMSGEFDALSYAFYRHAFEILASNARSEVNAPQRRAFTRRVGMTFFDQMATFLDLELPKGLETGRQFEQLQKAIKRIGAFLVAQGYLRDHFAFRFGLVIRQGKELIRQSENEFLFNLKNGLAYALYEMGYPAILPSAVYLFHLTGEAQHHSSRTVEELFRRIGYRASETDDFDPTGFPAHLVVELWEIRPL